MCDFGEDMGYCFLLFFFLLEIYEENEYGDGNVVVCYGDEFGLDYYCLVYWFGFVCFI